MLKGAKALALPANLGQELTAEPIESAVISWTSKVKVGLEQNLSLINCLFQLPVI